MNPAFGYVHYPRCLILIGVTTVMKIVQLVIAKMMRWRLSKKLTMVWLRWLDICHAMTMKMKKTMEAGTTATSAAIVGILFFSLQKCLNMNMRNVFSHRCQLVACLSVSVFPRSFPAGHICEWKMLPRNVFMTLSCLLIFMQNQFVLH